MNTYKYFLILLLLFFIGCNRQHVYICSPDESNCITIITRAFSINEVRYLIDGKHTRIPDSNYVKMRISRHYPPGDALYVCWVNNQVEWEAVIRKATIVRNTLDSSRFIFKTELETDERGIPTDEKYKQKGCAIIGLYNDIRVAPDGDAIIIHK